MTRIRARCPGCGDVEFGVDAIVVVGDEYTATTYRFACPDCGDQVSRSAVPDVIALLLSAGVRQEEIRVEQQRSDGTPLTDEDVESFRSLLRSPDWFAQLQASVERRDQ